MSHKVKALNILVVVTLLAGLLGLMAGCDSAAPTTTAAATTAPTTTAAPANPQIIMASTTSTGDSGLMDVLIPVFEAKTGYTIKPIYVGTGAAMAMGERGEADVLLVHAPATEATFMQNGHGVERKLVMHNDFVIVGPADDPAGISGMTVAKDAFARIAETGSIFISRGDDSGTNKSEIALWKAASVNTTGQRWYQQSGQGMGATLTIASEKQGYTLTDRATYLAMKANISLEVLTEGDPFLLNIYHVITVNPDKNNRINAEGAQAFLEFMISDEAQESIRTYGVDKYGEPLFFPDAYKTEADLGSV